MTEKYKYYGQGPPYGINTITERSKGAKDKVKSPKGSSPRSQAPREPPAEGPETERQIQIQSEIQIQCVDAWMGLGAVRSIPPPVAANRQLVVRPLPPSSSLLVRFFSAQYHPDPDNGRTSHYSLLLQFLLDFCQLFSVPSAPGGRPINHNFPGLSFLHTCNNMFNNLCNNLSERHEN